MQLSPRSPWPRLQCRYPRGSFSDSDVKIYTYQIQHSIKKYSPLTAHKSSTAIPARLGDVSYSEPSCPMRQKAKVASPAPARTRTSRRGRCRTSACTRPPLDGGARGEAAPPAIQTARDCAAATESHSCRACIKPGGERSNRDDFWLWLAWRNSAINSSTEHLKNIIGGSKRGGYVGEVAGSMFRLSGVAWSAFGEPSMHHATTPRPLAACRENPGLPSVQLRNEPYDDHVIDSP